MENESVYLSDNICRVDTKDKILEARNGLNVAYLTDYAMLMGCSVCGHTVTESLPTAGHRYAENVVPPTATEQGYTQHTCVLCGFTYKDTYLPPRP